MKPTEFIVENSIIAQEADDMHRDHEVQMARSQMYSAAQAAIEIHRLLRDVSEMEGLEGWVQSKLTLASQYLESVRDYMKYEAVSQDPEMMVFAEAAANYAIESMINEREEVYPDKRELPPVDDRSSKKIETPKVNRQEVYPDAKKTPIEDRTKKLKERMHNLERRIREQSTPVVGGMSKSTAPGGDITTRSDIGGTSVSQTKTPGGFVKQTTANMDMGGAGTASMVKQAPQQSGQLAGTTTVTRTAAAGPKYDADAGVFGNAPAATPASGSAVQGVGFAGAGKGVTAATPKVVTTGNQDLAQQAKSIMPVSEEGDDMRVRKPGGDYVVDRGYAPSRPRDRILSTPDSEINPGLKKYAERNTPRKMGDPGLPGAKDNYDASRPQGVKVRDFTQGGTIIGGTPTKIERPEGVPRVSKKPITSFGGGGVSGHMADPSAVKSLIPNFEDINEMGETGEERDLAARREEERYDSARNYQGRNARGDVIRQGDYGSQVVKANPNPPSMIQRAAGKLGLPNTATDALGDPMYKSSKPAGSSGSRPGGSGGGVRPSGGGGGGGGGGVNPFEKRRSLYFEKKASVKESATGGASSAGAVATSIGGPGHKQTSGVPKKLNNAHKSKKITVGKGIYDK